MNKDNEKGVILACDMLGKADNAKNAAYHYAALSGSVPTLVAEVVYLRSVVDDLVSVVGGLTDDIQRIENKSVVGSFISDMLDADEQAELFKDFVPMLKIMAGVPREERKDAVMKYMASRIDEIIADTDGDDIKE